MFDKVKALFNVATKTYRVVALNDMGTEVCSFGKGLSYDEAYHLMSVVESREFFIAIEDE